MLLAIDIGNSSINMGIWRGKVLKGKLKIPSYPQKESNHYKNKIKFFLSKNNVEIPLMGVIISSVIPKLTGVVEKSVRGLSETRPMTVNISLNTGLKFDVKKPAGLGSDRISNAVAAMKMLGSPALAIDFGTATTISAVKGRRFIGGAILPGLGLMGDALGRGTAKLPFVGIESKHRESHIPATGKDTAACITSGILYGTAGAAERIIDEMEREEHCKFKVVITGGHCGLMTGFLRRKHFVDPDLTLKGLRLIYERNA